MCEGMHQFSVKNHSHLFSIRVGDLSIHESSTLCKCSGYQLKSGQ